MTGNNKKIIANPLPALLRFYIYGIQGFCDEIVFTSLLDFFLHGDWKLKGYSSVSSFFIYGSCCIVVERLYVFMRYKHNIKLYLRIPAYMVILYTWEFVFGLILRQFDACPWDYSHYRFNVMGLITLEYAPGWFVLCLLQDWMFDYLLRMQVLSEVVHNTKKHIT